MISHVTITPAVCGPLTLTVYLSHGLRDTEPQIFGVKISTVWGSRDVIHHVGGFL